MATPKYTADVIKVETVTIDNSTGQPVTVEPTWQEKLHDSIFTEDSRKWFPVQLYTKIGTVSGNRYDVLASKGYALAAERYNGVYGDIEFFITRNRK